MAEEVTMITDEDGHPHEGLYIFLLFHFEIPYSSDCSTPSSCSSSLSMDLETCYEFVFPQFPS